MAQKSNRQIKDLEYNVYGDSGKENGHNIGCLTFTAILALVVVIFFVVSKLFTSTATNRVYCAYPGCHNNVTSGNYCWMHKSRSLEPRRKQDIKKEEEEKEKKKGSITDGGSTSADHYSSRWDRDDAYSSKSSSSSSSSGSSSSSSGSSSSDSSSSSSDSGGADAE